ncbi:mucin-5AC-like [Paramacrobiotus metropolitanus]|uniref:mucin-5AC-like n=1 Tax=Paramacrobiotus metropolitanus TaxID=2943436 RepID=UPI002445A07E|nr:mucin-5AC-like [Paramacrobiotus metropolitanus]
MEEDDWDNPAPPLSRSDRIQRITSPDSTLQRPPRAVAPTGHPPVFHVGSTGSLARSAQQQQLQLAAGFHPLDVGLLDPGHVATLRRQAHLLALQAAHTNSLPRGGVNPQFGLPVPVSPTTSHRILNQRYKQAASLPPTAGTRVTSPTAAAQRLEMGLDKEGTLRRGPYWGQVNGSYDPYSVAGGGTGGYPGDGSTSSYARVGHNRQSGLPSHPPQPQTAEPIYNLQHDESTSLTSQKTSRTQTSMLTKSAPTPSGSGGSGSGGSGGIPAPKPSMDGSGSTTLSASAKYAEYISSLEKYQHPPPSKRHVTFIKYRGRQCTIGMLAVFALLVIGLVVAPVVYFTAFANKSQNADSSAETRLTNFINGQITLDTTHGAYADLMTDPARPPDDAGLKRVQRDMENLLKDVLHGPGGFAADEVNSVMVSQPQRPDTHQIFLRFQVLLSSSMSLDAAEAKTSKAFASATSTDPLGTNLKTTPIIANSLFYRAVPQSNSTSAAAADLQLLPPIDDTGNAPRPTPTLRHPTVGTTGSTPAPPMTPPPPASSPMTTRATTTTSTMTTTTTTTTPRTTTTPSTTPRTSPALLMNPDDETFSVAGKVPNRKPTRPPETTAWAPETPTFAFTLPQSPTFAFTPPPPAPSVFTRPLTTPALTTKVVMPEFVPTSMEPNRMSSAPESTWPVTQPQGAPQFTGPQFIQVFDPQAGTSRAPGFLPELPDFPPHQQQFNNFNNQNFQPQPESGQRPPPPMDNAFHPLPFNRFSLDDANAQAASETTVLTTKSTTTTKKAPTTSTTAAPTTTVAVTTSMPKGGEMMREEERTIAPEKREFSAGTDSANLPSRAGEFVKDVGDFGEAFASTAPLLVSEWGNWSEWGACSSPRCSSDGFQMRTRACLTSVNGAPAIADHDASCTVNGGQGIEARPCVCESAALPVTELPPEDETYLPEPVPSTVAIVSTSPAAKISPVTWSEWTEWSVCSIAPCHPSGIQTRHRTCRLDAQQVPDEMCLAAEGAAVETRPCDCPLETVTPPGGEAEAVTTPTFVRPSTGARDGAVQPQRNFNMQIQNRPLQKRPATNSLPRTCTFYEKPCNNGQCILSYRVCDGFPDCSDGSDEPLGCGRCFSGEFKCTNGRCISESLVCDGKDNCGDGTDEFFC